MKLTMCRTNPDLARRLPRVHGRKLVVGISSILMLGASNPSEGEPQRMSLRDALNSVQRSHPDRLEPSAAIAEAEAAVARARAGRLPKGEARVLFGIVNGARRGEVPDNLPEELAPLFAQGGPDDPFFDLGPFVRGSLRLTQPIFTFGKIRQGIKAAEAGVAARKAHLSSIESDLRIQMLQLYYGYQLASDLQRALEKVEASFRQATHQAESRLESGEGAVTQIDILKLTIAAQSLTRRILGIRRQKDTALLAFRRALGRSLDAPVFPASDRLKAVPLLTDTSTAILNRAYEQAAWYAVTAGLRARQAAETSAARQLYPNLFVGVHAEANWAPTRDDIVNPFLRDDFNRLRGGPFLGLQWDLDVAGHLAKRQQAAAMTAAHRAKLEKARLGLPLQIQNALATYLEKKAALDISHKSRKAGRSLSFLSVANFRIGVGEPKEILEALGLYTRTLGEYYQAIYEFNLAAGTLAELTGLDFPPKVLP